MATSDMTDDEWYELLLQIEMKLNGQIDEQLHHEFNVSIRVHI